ncbi:acyl-CoA dehydrogenase family protein [Subtercola endophyticus]|uniref:acyl-CoA dehydrogenase family protein n=1 Tax=Subtercola endophyticus TaxID=2895559 RepID=UPI001E5356FE|nr:acyl-CoA dehydrogenase family protein [Subtercola endophyticus]UFS57453.1 acyl-CoA dehydrogenase family protein [Subtercola endophyticus]
MATHSVFNQVPPRENVDEFTTNVPLVEAVSRYDAGWAIEALGDVGRHVGTEQFQHDAERANTVEPELHSHDRYGNRIDEVEYDSSYHRVLSAAVSHGAHTSAWAEPRPGANVARAATFMLFAQVEPGHACPVSMTHAAVPVIQSSAPAEVVAEWMPRLLSTSYEAALVPGKTSAQIGMAMTEKQGGSDVRANTTEATPLGGGEYLVTGHKWFCSAPMSDAFLVLAQAPGGLSCFLVARVLPDGSRNVFRIQRLKDKLGNRSNASSEIEFDQTRGLLVGEEGRGVKTIIEMVSRTRLDCIFGTAAGMRQASAEALWHVRHRAAFGALLVDQPAMTNVVADLALESEAATETALRLARAHDADASDQDRAFRRLATAVSKYYICKLGPAHAYEALECLGGNGYTEGFPLARRYREQPVMAVWEGSGNVIALDVLRTLAREPSAYDAFDAELSLAAGVAPAFDAHLATTRELVREARLDPNSAAAALGSRRLVAALGLALQSSLLLRHAPTAVSEAFVRSRLADARARFYGELPPGIRLTEILDRA